MSQRNINRRAIQRETLTIGKLVDGVRKYEQAAAKRDYNNKIRQDLRNNLMKRPLGNY